MPPSASNQYQHPNTKTNMSNKIPEKCLTMQVIGDMDPAGGASVALTCHCRISSVAARSDQQLAARRFHSPATPTRSGRRPALFVCTATKAHPCYARRFHSPTTPSRPGRRPLFV